MDLKEALIEIYKKAKENYQFKNNEVFILALEENSEIKGYCICLSKHNKETDLKKFILIDLIALNK